MPDPLRQWMQESLDGVLSEELTHALFTSLQQDEQAAREYARLEDIDRVLANAPHVRAPRRLAVTIMARLAQTIEAQAKLQELPREVRDAVMVSLSLVMLTSLPLMMSGAWLLLRTSNPALLLRVLAQVVGLMRVVIEGQLHILDEVEAHLQDDPQLAAALMSLMPAMLEGLLNAVEDASHSDNPR